MDPETFYVVLDEQLLHLERQAELPPAFLDAVPANISTVLDAPAMVIGAWEDRTEGPLVLTLGATGELTSIIAVNSSHLEAIPETLASIDSWLATLRLRDLSEMSGNHAVFYEGLWDLSPDSSVLLSSTRHYVLLTALETLPMQDWAALLRDAKVSVCYLDVLQASGSPALVRRRPMPASATNIDSPAPLSAVPYPETSPTLNVVEDVIDDGAATLARPHLESVSTAPATLHEVSNEPDTAQVVDFSPVEIPRIDIAPPALVPEDIKPLEPQFQDVTRVVEFSVGVGIDDSATPVVIDLVDIEADVIDLIAADADSTIDLNDPVVNGFVDDLELALVVSRPLTQGSNYELNELPLVFDATGTTLESISDELFAVENDIILVISLPDRRRGTPFEDRSRFRWDTSLNRIQLLNDHGVNHSGVRRVVHLFAESERQPGYATYIGELERDAFQTHANTETETAWFSIEPRLDADLYRQLKRGRLPQRASVKADTIT